MIWYITHKLQNSRYYVQVANLLLAHGASPDQAGKNGMTPLHIAAQYDQQAVATTLLEKGADAKVYNPYYMRK